MPSLVNSKTLTASDSKPSLSHTLPFTKFWGRFVQKLCANSTEAINLSPTRPARNLIPVIKVNNFPQPSHGFYPQTSTAKIFISSLISYPFSPLSTHPITTSTKYINI